MPNRKNKNTSEIRQLARSLRNLAISAGPPSVVKPNKPKRKRKGKKKDSRPSVKEGEITISRHELIGTLKVPAKASSSSGSVKIDPSQFAFLKVVGKAFARSKWHSLHVYYKPAVGTNFGGLISMGFMLDPDASVPTTRADIVALTPAATCAAWFDTENKPLVLKGSQLATRDWYFHNDINLKQADRGPAVLCWAADIAASTSEVMLGEMWITYSLTMQGTNTV